MCASTARSISTGPSFPPRSPSPSWWCPSTAGAASPRRRSRLRSPCRTISAACTCRSPTIRTISARTGKRMIAAPLRDAGQMRAQSWRSCVALPLRSAADGRLRAGAWNGNRNFARSACWCRNWWCGTGGKNLLHNRRADLLKVILLMRGNRRIIVINIPWYLEDD